MHDELVQQLFDAEIGDCRTEKNRRLFCGEIIVQRKRRAGAHYELNFLAKLLHAVAQNLGCLRGLQAVDPANFGRFFATDPVA